MAPPPRRVALDDPAEHVGVVPLEPRQQRRPDVEAQVLVVVDDGSDTAVLVDDTRPPVGAVALGGDALVPVVERRGRRLDRHLLRPRVLPRRLVEVPVDHQADGFAHRRTIVADGYAGTSQTTARGGRVSRTEAGWPCHGMPSSAVGGVVAHGKHTAAPPLRVVGRQGDPPPPAGRHAEAVAVARHRREVGGDDHGRVALAGRAGRRRSRSGRRRWPRATRNPSGRVVEAPQRRPLGLEPVELAEAGRAPRRATVRRAGASRSTCRGSTRVAGRARRP